MQAALEADRDAGTRVGVRLLSISFDGAHDSSTVLQAYARTLQDDPVVWNWGRVPNASAVSYKHLNVYKEQGPTRTGEALFTLPAKALELAHGK